VYFKGVYIFPEFFHCYFAFVISINVNLQQNPFLHRYQAIDSGSNLDCNFFKYSTCQICFQIKFVGFNKIPFSGQVQILCTIERFKKTGTNFRSSSDSLYDRAF
jgi:hypothetical protein